MKSKTSNSQKLLQSIFSDIFYVSLGSLMVYLMVELFIPGLVTNYFNLNILVVMTLISGVIMTLITP